MSSYSPAFIAGIVIAMAGAGYAGWNMSLETTPKQVSAIQRISGETIRMPICGSGKRVTCVVDGDTIWYRGEKIRLEGFNAPETQGLCARESELARRATLRLRAVLSSEPFSVTRNGKDRYGRTLATIRNSQGDVGNVLIAEGLAHEWRGRKENWCGL